MLPACAARNGEWSIPGIDVRKRREVTLSIPHRGNTKLGEIWHQTHLVLRYGPEPIVTLISATEPDAQIKNAEPDGILCIFDLV